MKKFFGYLKVRNWLEKWGFNLALGGERWAQITRFEEIQYYGLEKFTHDSGITQFIREAQGKGQYRSCSGFGYRFRRLSKKNFSDFRFFKNQQKLKIDFKFRLEAKYGVFSSNNG